MGFAQDIVSDRVAPPFFQGPAGLAYLTAMGQALDAVRVRSSQAAVVHMPGHGDPSALPILGLDRQLTQGASETNAAFVVRLQTAFDIWQRAGNDWTILQQVLVQIPTLTPPALIVSNTSSWSYYAAGASTAVPPANFTAHTANWNWDNGVDPVGNVGTPWWRFWLVIGSYAPNAWASAAPVLGSGGPALGANPGTTSLGFSNIGSQFWTTLRRIIATYKAANSWCRWIVVNFNSGSMNPNFPVDTGINPDGTFGPSFSIAAGAYSSTRFGDARYVDGVA